MKRVPIATASAAQLATYANAYLGLDVDPKMGAHKIRAVMSTAGYDKDFIELEETEPTPVRAAVKADAEKARGDKVLIRIQNQSGPGGKDHVPIGVNGTVYRIMRGVDVAVPRAVLEVLDNARVCEYETDKDGQIIGFTMIHTHPFSVIADPAPAAA